MVWARIVSSLIMVIAMAPCSAFAPPGTAHALLRTSALKPSSISMAGEDRVFELKIQLGDVSITWHAHAHARSAVHGV